MDVHFPFIFLGGPIQGAPDWQAEAILIIHKINPEVLVASPRRPAFPPNAFEEQVRWERHYLDIAGEPHSRSAIMFWFPKEEVAVPGRAYAQTSRWEVATWKERHKTLGSQVVIGIEEGFSGGRYMKSMLDAENPDIPLLNSLEETCKRAVSLL